MNWTRLRAVMRKEFIQILRDSRSLAIVLLMPLAMMLLFGYGVSLDIKHMPVYVFDRDGSQESQDLIARFRASAYFEIAGSVADYGELVRALDEGRAKMGLVVPHDFSNRLHQGGVVSVQALVDATDDNTANLLFAYAEAVVRGYSQELQLAWLARRGQKPPPQPLAVEARTWFNEDLESNAFIVPGVIALVMSVMGAFLTSLTIAREWERGTMEQLISTPVTPLELMLGKLAPYFLIGLFDVALCAGLGILWFGVPFRGSLVLLFATSSLFLLVVLSVGYLISVIAKNQLAASQMALVSTFLPAFLLSGFLFAIEQMPVFIRAVSYLLPARYFVSILKEIFLKGSGFRLLLPEIAPLAVFALVQGLLATRAFHKRLA